MKTYSDFISTVINESYSYGMFDYLLEQESDCVIDGVTISGSSITLIRRFYENTNTYNRTKISDMINNNIRNIDRVVNLIREYKRVKSEEGTLK